MKIEISNGGHTLVDHADYARLSRYSWHATKLGYVCRKERGKRITMHGEVLRPNPGLLVDHINGDTKDNRRRNLREATHTQNMQNRKRHSGSVSKFKGVWHDPRRGVWRAQISSNGERIQLGSFRDEVRAAKQYDRAARLFHGEFARTNF